ncbi:hypothetical protein ElyMa_002364600 [Elysia marginata]|uniref:Uncharacterized protein n=1 Tax=Elysia marginata TaxID=1093978 RepID=A0AAV4GAB1_9GAST|nr:hypothetical protein ElyMa_002364600 [Elysia marginata]
MGLNTALSSVFDRNTRSPRFGRLTVPECLLHDPAAATALLSPLTGTGIGGVWFLIRITTATVIAAQSLSRNEQRSP